MEKIEFERKEVTLSKLRKLSNFINIQNSEFTAQLVSDEWTNILAEKEETARFAGIDNEAFVDEEVRENTNDTELLIDFSA